MAEKVFQFGAVGVGYGQKAHFVYAEERMGNGVKGFFNVDVMCGSVKQIGWGKSGVRGFACVGSAFVYDNEKEVWASARAEAFAEFADKYGEQACKKCVKDFERVNAWSIENGWVK